MPQAGYGTGRQAGRGGHEQLHRVPGPAAGHTVVELVNAVGRQGRAAVVNDERRFAQRRRVIGRPAAAASRAPAAAELEHIAGRAAEVFLAAYGPS